MGGVTHKTLMDPPTSVIVCGPRDRSICVTWHVRVAPVQIRGGMATQSAYWLICHRPTHVDLKTITAGWWVLSGMIRSAQICTVVVISGLLGLYDCSVCALAVFVKIVRLLCDADGERRGTVYIDDADGWHDGRHYSQKKWWKYDQ